MKFIIMQGMNFRILFTFLLLFEFGFADYQKVKIGTIDSKYSKQLNKQQLKKIINEIENKFESQLGFNVFDYSTTGKPIDIIYQEPSRKKRNFENILKDIDKKKKQIDNLKDEVNRLKNSFGSSQDRLEIEQKEINRLVSQLNRYINNANRKKITSNEELNSIKRYIKDKKATINSKSRAFETKRKNYNRKLNNYNRKISSYNSFVNSYNRLQRKAEIISRSLKEVKGVAKGYTKTTYKTIYEDGKVFKTKSSKNYMEKIEIYGFKNLKELKAILAHELAHLVGVRHVNRKGALMNPVLQQNQVKRLELTTSDIRAFKQDF